MHITVIESPCPGVYRSIIAAANAAISNQQRSQEKFHLHSEVKALRIDQFSERMQKIDQRAQASKHMEKYQDRFQKRRLIRFHDPRMPLFFAPNHRWRNDHSNEGDSHGTQSNLSVRNEFFALDLAKGGRPASAKVADLTHPCIKTVPLQDEGATNGRMMLAAG